jgi:hypothetical protein
MSENAASRTSVDSIVRRPLRVSWDDVAMEGEKCCKELEDRRWRDNSEPMPECGKPAAYVIVSDDGERLSFCHRCWRN